MKSFCDVQAGDTHSSNHCALNGYGNKGILLLVFL
jgi:hypothetical protein